MCYYTACGFGYVRSTNEYKVVRIFYLDKEDEEYEQGNVEVYTLGSGCGWRAIGSVPYQLNTSNGGKGTYLNDAIYWTAGTNAVAFDLAGEEFRMLSAPACIENIRYGGCRCELVALGRHLCFYMDNNVREEIWFLMKGSDSKESWCKMFDIDYEANSGSPHRMLQPILLTKKGEIVLLYSDISESVLYSYDMQTTILKIISNEASTDHFEALEAIAHINTFASLKAMGEDSKRYAVRQRAWDDVSDEIDHVPLGEELDTTYFRFS